MIGNGGNGVPSIQQCRRSTSWPSACTAFTFPSSTTSYTAPLLQGTQQNAPAAQAGTLGVLAGCIVPTGAKCPTSADLNVFACSYGQGTGATRAICGAPAATAAGANNGFGIPMFNWVSSSLTLTIAECRWNGMGGAQVTGTAGDVAPTVAPTQISNFCPSGQTGYSIPVSSSLTAVAAGAAAGFPTTAAGAATTAVQGCLVTGATPNVCYFMGTTNGWPLAATAQVFIQSGTVSGSTPVQGTLVGCAGITNGNACANDYAITLTQNAGTQPAQTASNKVGCQGSTGGNTVAICNQWTTPFYPLFTPAPGVTCA